MPVELYDVEFDIAIPEVSKGEEPKFQIKNFNAKVHSDTAYEIKRTFITTYEESEIVGLNMLEKLKQLLPFIDERTNDYVLTEVPPSALQTLFVFRRLF